MNIVSCPSCGARFDVSSFQPGSSFRCGSCQSILKVPLGRSPAANKPAVGTTRPGSGRRSAAPGRSATPGRSAAGGATRGRAGTGTRGAPGKGAGAQRQSKRVDPRRAGAAVAASSAPPAAGGRPQRRERNYGRRSGGPSGMNPMPYLIGGAGAIIVVVILILVLSSGHKSKDSSQQTAKATVTKKSQKPKVTRDTLESRLFAVSTPSGYYEIFQQAKTYPDIQKEAAKGAVRLDPTLDWANKALGKKDLKTILDKIPTKGEVDIYSDAAYRELDKWRSDNVRWVSEETYQKASQDLSEATKYAEKRATDPVFANLTRVRTWIRLHPLFGQMTFTSAAYPPYVLFVEHSHDNSKAAIQHAEKICKRDGKIFQCLYHTFLATYGKRFGLPKLKDLKNKHLQVLKVFCFDNRKDFEIYQGKIREPLPGGVQAYYRPNDQWVYTYAGHHMEEHNTNGGSSFGVNCTFHEGTHQLIHLYSKILLQKQTGKEVVWTDPRLQSKEHWFQEGIAEFMGSSKPTKDGSWQLMVPYESRLREWRMTQAHKFSEWSLPELLKVTGNGSLAAGAQRLSGPRPGDAGRLMSLFYAQAWSFVYFLWNYDNGKYRGKFLDYMGDELHGKSGYSIFKKIMKPKDDNWPVINKEWRGFVAHLMKSMGIE